MRVDLVEMLAQSPDLDDRSSPPRNRLIGVVSDLSSDLKSTQQNIPRTTFQEGSMGEEQVRRVGLEPTTR